MLLKKDTSQLSKKMNYKNKSQLQNINKTPPQTSRQTMLLYPQAKTAIAMAVVGFCLWGWGMMTQLVPCPHVESQESRGTHSNLLAREVEWLSGEVAEPKLRVPCL